MSVELRGKRYRLDADKGIDVSVAFHQGGARAWNAGPMRVSPVVQASFTGSVAKGGDVNFRDIWFNPHAHGTHTECMGHITREVSSVNRLLRRYLLEAQLRTVSPLLYQAEELPWRKPGDRYISEGQLRGLGVLPEALLLRTLPNDSSKLSRNYSDTNPPYFEADALGYLRRAGVNHLLTDLPSVDRERDGGQLLAHRAFWGDRELGGAATITEFIYAPPEVPDGHYLLSLQVAPFENDAAPSRPVLYALEALI